MSRVVLRALVATAVLSVISLAACAPNPRDRLEKYAGIRPCAAATIKSVESGYGDVLAFALSADKEICSPALSESIITASAGGCAGLIEKEGACSYTFNSRSVGVERQKGSERIDKYQVKTW